MSRAKNRRAKRRARATDSRRVIADSDAATAPAAAAAAAHMPVAAVVTHALGVRWFAWPAALFGAIVVFVALHFFANGLPPGLAAQRIAETLPSAGEVERAISAGELTREDVLLDYGDNLPVVNGMRARFIGGFRVGTYLYCEVANMVLAGAQSAGGLRDALLPNRLYFRDNAFHQCPAVRDALAGVSHKQVPAKLRYLWGGNAVFAIALRVMSVRAFHRVIFYATHAAFLALALALFLLAPRAFLVGAPVVAGGVLYFALESYADVTNGVAALWAVASAAGLAVILRVDKVARYAGLFCFCGGLVSAFLWSFDGHNFMALALYGFVAYLAAVYSPTRRETKAARRPVVFAATLIALFTAGFFASYTTMFITKSAAVDASAADEILEPYIKLDNKKYDNPFEEYAALTGYYLARVFTPKGLDLAGRSPATYAQLIEVPPAAVNAALVGGGAAVVAALLIGAYFRRKRRARVLHGVLWLAALVALACLNFVVPNDEPLLIVRYMFLPTALAYAAIVFALCEVLPARPADNPL